MRKGSYGFNALHCILCRGPATPVSHTLRHPGHMFSQLAQTIQHTAELSHHIRTTEYLTWTRGFSFTIIHQSIASSGNSPSTGKWATNYASSPRHLKHVRTRSLQLNMGMAQRHHIQILVFLTPVEIISRRVPIRHTSPGQNIKIEILRLPGHPTGHASCARHERKCTVVHGPMALR